MENTAGDQELDNTEEGTAPVLSKNYVIVPLSYAFIVVWQKFCI